MTTTHLRFVRDDGGRADAGRRGDTGDCVTRAFAIATGRPYADVYALFADGMANLPRRRPSSRPRRSASHGVSPKVYKPVFAAAGFVWLPTMSIGSGTTVHVRADELPVTGRHILRLSGHLAAWVDGTLRDTYDCSRDGTRAVYGVWSLPDE